MLGNNTCLWVTALAASSTFAQATSNNGINSTSGVPQIKLDQGTFNGVHNGTVDKFLGIRYAKPPFGDLRLRFPVPNDPYTGEQNATSFGFACLQPDLPFPIPDALDPQTKAVLQAGFGSFSQQSEDCLTVNVWKPSNLLANKKVPVLVWIYGGAFEVGGSATYVNDGSIIVQRSIELGEPIVLVSLNYRLGPYGFLGGAEVEAAGVANIGLQDQRQAFRWVQKYIGAFGGDHSKVTIWGQSAGAISAGLHLLANGGNTEGLFHAAFLESGSIPPVGEISKGQRWYDSLVRQSGCAGTNDTLACIRETVPAEVIDAIEATSPSVFSTESLNLTWIPRADGKFLQDLPYQAVLKGKIANVPFVAGDTDDEGTLFTLSLANITTNDEVHYYIHSNYFPDATSAEIDQLLKLYPDDVAQGSPFDTGSANAVTPQWKRLSAIQGDLLFNGPRRFLLQNRVGKQPTWSYLAKRSKSLPDLGSFHSSDLGILFGGGDLADYLINFVNHHDPNGKGNANWPQYTPANPTLFTLLDGNVPHTLSKDDFRTKAIDYANKLLTKYPW
ncbi:carotenoid ester lipase precursor [Irpex lacteus]|nr:carotenoid ester lipase precursor [Irpex lacteus]KAI0777045.1 carotenoid ester lipase precursor [Irpex lacteus]